MLPHAAPVVRLGLQRATSVCWPFASQLHRSWWSLPVRCPSGRSARMGHTACMAGADEAKLLEGLGSVLLSASDPVESVSAGQAAAANGSAACTGGKRKRKAALFLAYVGTAYQGSQLQRNDPNAATVEGVLETALFRAGGIIESNMGALEKIGWSRSSRTDKGVHSLATVVTLKLEVDVERFAVDSEGLHLARSINKHLPPEVRVLSVQRVNRSFNARTDCRGRVYHYYLPASVLGLKSDGSAEDAAVLERLQAALSAYVGTHAFHNFTKRRLYRPPGPGQKNLWRKRPQRGARAASSTVAGADADGVAVDSPAAGVALEEDDDAEEEAGEVDEGTATPGAPDLELPGAQGSAASPAVSWREARRSLSTPLDMNLRWNEERDATDPISRGHFRMLSQVEASQPVPLAPGGPLCLQVTVAGASFMLHQIRHMIGGAVLVARGQAPLAWLHAALSPHARTHVPLAPPQVLVLAGAEFFPFRKSPPVVELSGRSLSLRVGGMAAQHAFCQEVLYPALQPLLLDETWSRWEVVLGRVTCSPDVLQAFLASHQAWKVFTDARQAQREEERAAHAAALTEAGLLADADGGYGKEGRQGAKGGRPVEHDPEREQRRAAGRLAKQTRKVSAH